MFALRSNQVHEISDYQNTRYVSSNEVGWRILQFPIHERDPPVHQLAVHLENSQRVYFIEDTALDQASRDLPKTTLSSLHCVGLMTLPRLYSTWRFLSIIHGTTNPGAEGNKAQMWLAL